MPGERIVVLTGAGLSAESGLGTFRDAGGLWSRYDLAEVATPEGFARDRALVHGFYNARRDNCRAAEPNAAHRALARLSLARAGEVLLVTQNIDDLLERAGAVGVVHMHGSVLHGRCAACGARWEAPAAMAPDNPCPGCGAAETRPDVVWFGEMPHEMERIEAALQQADLFVAIGTSGSVYPAAGFVALAGAAGAVTLEINIAPSDVAGQFDEVRIGPASQLVPEWIDGLIGDA